MLSSKNPSNFSNLSNFSNSSNLSNFSNSSNLSNFSNSSNLSNFSNSSNLSNSSNFSNFPHAQCSSSHTLNFFALSVLIFPDYLFSPEQDFILRDKQLNFQ